MEPTNERETAVFFLNIPLENLRKEPTGNIRFNVGDVSDIYPSIKKEGVLHPISVRPGEEEGTFYVMEGNRRWACAERAGHSTIPAIVQEANASQVRKIMMTSTLKKEQPHLVLNADGEIVGGMAWAIREEIEETNATNLDLAELLGVTPDTIGAYRRLHDESIEVKTAVSSGKIAITAYSRMKTQSEEIKKQIATKDKEKISARDVKDEMKRMRRDSGQTNFDMPYFEEEECGITQQLTGILAQVRRLDPGDFSDSDFSIVAEIGLTLEDLMSNY